MPINEIIMSAIAILLDRGQKPAFIMLGPKLYFALCEIETDPELTEFCGCRIVVTDTDVDSIRVMEGPLECALAMSTPDVH